MELSAISSALSIISSRFLDSAYRIGASIAGLALVWSWFSDEYDGPDEALLSALTALGIPTDWLDATLLWMTEREELVVGVGGVLLAFAVLSLALTQSFSQVLSQRSSSTIWLLWAALAVVHEGGWGVVVVLVICGLLSLIIDLVIMDERISIRGRGQRDWERFGARGIALVGALIFGPLLVIMQSIGSPQRRQAERSDES